MTGLYIILGHQAPPCSVIVYVIKDHAPSFGSLYKTSLRKLARRLVLLPTMESPYEAAIRRIYPDLVSSIEQSPVDVALQLMPAGIFPPAVWTFISNSQKSPDKEKAIKIVETVLEQLKHNSQVFFTFISALEAAGPWTKPITDKLKLCTHESTQDCGK